MDHHDMIDYDGLWLICNINGVYAWNFRRTEYMESLNKSSWHNPSRKIGATGENMGIAQFTAELTRVLIGWQAEWETTSRKWGWIWLEKVENRWAEMGHHIELQCFSDVNHIRRNNVKCFAVISLNIFECFSYLASHFGCATLMPMFLPAWWMGREVVFHLLGLHMQCYKSVSLYIYVSSACWEFMNII